MSFLVDLDCKHTKINRISQSNIKRLAFPFIIKLICFERTSGGTQQAYFQPVSRDLAFFLQIGQLLMSRFLNDADPIATTKGAKIFPLRCVIRSTDICSIETEKEFFLGQIRRTQGECCDTRNWPPANFLHILSGFY